MKKLATTIKLVLLGSALSIVFAASVGALEAGGSCQPPKDTQCGSCVDGFCPYGNYTPSAD